MAGRSTTGQEMEPVIDVRGPDRVPILLEKPTDELDIHHRTKKSWTGILKYDPIQ